MKKSALFIALIITVSYFTYAQNLFHVRTDTSCTPFTPIHPEGTINGALTYNWNFGNGQTSTAANAFVTYTTAGNYTISLTVTTATTDRIIKELTVTSIPNSWNDGILTDPEPDLYFKIKDQNGTILFNSPAIFDQFPPVTFKYGVLLKPNLMYSLELWEYDLIGQDDLLAYMTINTNTAQATLTNSGATLNYTTDTGKNSYAYSKTVTAKAQPIVTLTNVNGVLTPQVNQTLIAPTYAWYLNGGILTSVTTPTFRPTEAGNYTVRIATAGGCSGTSNVVNFTKVATVDLDPQNNWAIAPNPAEIGQNMQLNLISDKEQLVKMTIFDTVGKVLKEEERQLKSGDNQLHLAAFDKAGMFLIRMSTADGQKTLKVVVQ
jgi:hypothetical protein